MSNPLRASSVGSSGDRKGTHAAGMSPESGTTASLRRIHYPREWTLSPVSAYLPAPTAAGLDAAGFVSG